MATIHIIPPRFRAAAPSPPQPLNTVNRSQASTHNSRRPLPNSRTWSRMLRAHGLGFLSEFLVRVMVPSAGLRGTRKRGWECKGGMDGGRFDLRWYVQKRSRRRALCRVFGNTCLDFEPGPLEAGHERATAAEQFIPNPTPFLPAQPTLLILPPHT